MLMIGNIIKINNFFLRKVFSSVYLQLGSFKIITCVYNKYIYTVFEFDY